MTAEQKSIVAGFPEFWQQVHDKYPLFFKAAIELAPLYNQMLSKPMSEPLHKVLRRIAKIISNSLGALIVLALNGYGNDAMKVARSMFEGAVIVGYLKLHPDELRDYLDFHWIRQKLLYEYLKKIEPDLAQRIPAEKVAEIERQVLATDSRFRDRRGNLRHSWSGVSLRKMAEEVGLGRLYPTFYSFASSMHHVDIGALSAQTEEDTLDVDVAPSEKWLGEALLAGHTAVLDALHWFNEVAGLGFDKELGAARETFNNAWSS